MQLHMFWALYIHAADAQDVHGRPGEAAGGLGRPAQPARSSSGACRGTSRATLALRHVPALDETLENYTTRGAYDEWWAKKENDFTRFWPEHADIPATMTTGWYDGFPHADTEYFAAMAAKNTRAAAAARRAVEPRRDARRRHLHARRRLRRADSRWGVQRYFEEQLDVLRPLAAARTAAGRPAGPDETPVRIFVMGGGSGRKTALGKLDHGGRWRDEQEWPLARAVPTTLHLHGDGSLRTEPPRRVGEPRHFTYDPEDPVPTIGGHYCAVGEFPAQGRGHGADVDAAAQPGAPAAEHHDAGPRRPEGVGGVLHGPGALPAAVGARRTCSSTRPSRSQRRSR